jgi:PadR family transcriptional regulator PadR
MGEDYLGEFEYLVMLAIARLDADAYGVTIRRELEERGGRRASFGAVYSTLRRLEAKGYLVSRTSDPEPVAGGRARKLFRTTDAGRDAMLRSQRLLDRMSEGLDLGVTLRS